MNRSTPGKKPFNEQASHPLDYAFKYGDPDRCTDCSILLKESPDHDCSKIALYANDNWGHSYGYSNQI